MCPRLSVSPTSAVAVGAPMVCVLVDTQVYVVDTRALWIRLAAGPKGTVAAEKPMHARYDGTTRIAVFDVLRENARRLVV